MKIHCFFMLNVDGLPIYDRIYSNVLKNDKITLATSFLAAIMHFSSEMTQKKIRILKMGDLRFYFKHHTNKIFVMITSTDSISMVVYERIDKLIQIYENFLDDFDRIEQTGEILENLKINQMVDDIVDFTGNFDKIQITKIKKIFEEEISNGELLASALISIRGDVFYTSLPIEDLTTAMREIEIRTISDRRNIISNPKFTWQGGDKLIYSQIITINQFKSPVYIVLSFDSRTTLGMADFTLEDVINKICSI